MRWSLLIAVFGLSITDVASLAQRPPDDQRLSSTRSTAEDAGFFASTGVVRFQLIQGRLCLDPPRHRKGSQNRDEGSVYESITVTAERGIPSMHYVCQTPDHHLTLSVQRARSVRIESWFPNLSERAVLEQPELGAISWTHTRGDLDQQHRGATLLHVRHCDRSNFDLHFGMLAQRLLQGQSIRELSERTEAQMLNQAHESSQKDRLHAEQIEQCVAKLGATRRSVRISAERQLLSWGTPIVPTVHQLLEGDLDVEQRDRLRSIMQRLRPSINDTPASLSRLLVNDRSYWTAISDQLDRDQWLVASAHLERFGVDRLIEPMEPEERIAAARTGK